MMIDDMKRFQLNLPNINFFQFMILIHLINSISIYIYIYIYIYMTVRVLNGLLF